MSIARATTEVPTDPQARRAWVIYQLRLRGKSLSSVALRLGVSRQAVGQALLAPSGFIETGIAAELGLEARTLFPERFDANGVRLMRTRPPQRSTRRRSPGSPQTGEAA